MSFTEFRYQTLQAYDFLHLFQKSGVRFQLGGSDQWGNITAGQDLIKRELGEEVYGITIPLLTRSDGKKFGKSEEGAIWLSAEKLSPYEFYQHLYRFPDQDVIRLLKFVTYLDLAEIREIELQMQSPSYTPNGAQKILAREVTKIVHGNSGVSQAESITDLAKPGSQTSLTLETFESLEKEIPTVFISEKDILSSSLIDALVLSKVFSSKGQARRMIEGGGVYLNNERVDNAALVIGKEHVLLEKYLLLSIGKKKKYLLKVG